MLIFCRPLFRESNLDLAGRGAIVERLANERATSGGCGQSGENAEVVGTNGSRRVDARALVDGRGCEFRRDGNHTGEAHGCVVRTVRSECGGRLGYTEEVADADDVARDNSVRDLNFLRVAAIAVEVNSHYLIPASYWAFQSVLPDSWATKPPSVSRRDFSDSMILLSRSFSTCTADSTATPASTCA